MQEYFRNRINKYALKWIRTTIAAVRNDSHVFESLSNSQLRAQADYKNRFFYELLQNARDVQGCSKIKIVLQNNQLLFCNNGEPIRERNFEGLCEPDRSSKKNNKAQECLPTENYSVYRVFPHGDQLQIVDLGNPLAEGNSVISFCGLKFCWRKS